LMTIPHPRVTDGRQAGHHGRNGRCGDLHARDRGAQP
jgi:hypothetical protein